MSIFVIYTNYWSISFWRTVTADAKAKGTAFVSPPGRTGRWRRIVLSKSVRSSVCLSVRSFVCLLPNEWTRSFEYEWTNFGANRHKWFAGQGHETVHL